jgi:hypothetical protein
MYQVGRIISMSPASSPDAVFTGDIHIDTVESALSLIKRGLGWNLAPN